MGQNSNDIEITKITTGGKATLYYDRFLDNGHTESCKLDKAQYLWDALQDLLEPGIECLGLDAKQWSAGGEVSGVTFKHDKEGMGVQWELSRELPSGDRQTVKTQAIKPQDLQPQPALNAICIRVHDAAVRFVEGQPSQGSLFAALGNDEGDEE
jgi:hypothetical protein